MTLQIRRDGKPSSWISTVSFHGLQHLLLLLIHMVLMSWLKTKCQRQWLFSHQDQASLSSQQPRIWTTHFVSVRLFKAACRNSNESHFQRQFYSDGSGRGGSSSSPHQSTSFCCWEMGVVGLELELHNGCLSELIKQKMFHSLCVGKHGHKWGCMPSVHGQGMMHDESYEDMMTAH